MPVAAIYGTKHYAIQSDHLNTPRRLIQSDGQVAWQWAYSAFGEEKPTIAKTRFANADLNQSFGSTTVPAVTFNLRYPGQYFDLESGLHYNGHRSYDGKTGRYSQSDPIGLQGGWNKFGYSNQNPLSFTDPSGLLSSAEALAHYRGGTGTALDMDFSEIPTALVLPTDFPAVKAATNSACFDRTMKIDDRTSFASLMKWLTVGNITLRLQGTLTTKCDCSWSFSGYLKSFDDIYDFNASTHRSIIGETLTTIGRNIPGKPYDIRIRGAKSISQEGRGYGIPTCSICRKD
jgi:RHS repeat-associated protein